ncbi:MAG: 3-keto-disaccharide hydrolase [Verrucomicrobiales bacterium]
MRTPLLVLVSVVAFPCLPAGLATAEERANPGWVSLFDGSSLKGWHVSAKSGHSRTSKNQSGGRWVIEDGAIVGSQDVPGNGGIIITDESFGDFEVALEMKNDFGPDSGLFLRSTEDGKAWQAMIDYHAGGNVMGIYGEGLGGKPHVRNYNFKNTPEEIDPKNTGEPPMALPVLPDAWRYFWRHGQWNELRARIVNNPPQITTLINGVKIMEWQEKELRHPEKGAIALQVHGGGDFTKQFVRYRNIRVKRLESKTAALIKGFRTVVEIPLPMPPKAAPGWGLDRWAASASWKAKD